jgi:hypothetical protein
MWNQSDYDDLVIQKGLRDAANFRCALDHRTLSACNVIAKSTQISTNLCMPLWPRVGMLM